MDKNKNKRHPESLQSNSGNKSERQFTEQQSSQDNSRQTSEHNPEETPSNKANKAPRSITNHDEQRKTTNAGDSGSPMREEEIEGD
jgi:hypothetical protein